MTQANSHPLCVSNFFPLLDSVCVILRRRNIVSRGPKARPSFQERLKLVALLADLNASEHFALDAFKVFAV